MDTVKIEQQQLTQPFFAEVEQLAAEHKLGVLQRSYTKMDTSTRLLVNALVWMGASTLGMIFLLALVVRLALPGPEVGLNNYLTAALLAAIGLIILYGCFRQGLLNLRAYQSRNREQVHLFTDGMVYLNGQNANLAVRWDDIEELMRGDIEDESSGTVILDRIYLTLKHSTEQQILFQPALPQRQEICTQVEYDYTNSRLSALLASYRAGERLAFDDLVVSLTGVSILHDQDTTARDELPWSQLQAPGGSLHVDQPYTTITTSGGSADRTTLFQEFTCEIPNACLLKALLATLEHD